MIPHSELDTAISNSINTCVSDIEKSQSDEQIGEILQKISSQFRHPNAYQHLIHQITQMINSNESALKTVVINNSENIITMFKAIKSIKEEFSKSKRGLDTLSSQMLILKKKYIEPFDKLKKSLVNKSNVEYTIKIFEKMKELKSDVGAIRNHYEKDTLVISESVSNFQTYARIKKTLAEYDSLKGYMYLKEDIDWFLASEEKIFIRFRNKFEEAVRLMDNPQILRFMEFFSNLGTNVVINEIKLFSNKILRELMVDTFLTKIIRGVINPICPIDMIGEMIIKIRKELKDFFQELERWTKILKNLGQIIETEYDKNNLVCYDDIMETEGLRGIYDLFIEKIQSSFAQIIEKLKKNQKFSNSLNYFVKDFLYVYFTIKQFFKNVDIDFTAGTMLNDLKEMFMERFRGVTSENFTRAWGLVKSIERSAEMNGTFEKENIVNVHIIEHLVDYIKKMSISFGDLSDEFTKNDSDLFSNSEILVHELQDTFCGLLIDNYFVSVFSKLDHSLHCLSTDRLNETLNVQKFFFFYYILYKMNDVFISFINSNINFLISQDIARIIQNKMEWYMNQFYQCFISRIAQDMKILLVNKDDISYFRAFCEKIKLTMRLFFDRDNYNNNRSYEKSVVKFTIFIYMLGSILLLLMSGKDDSGDDESYDEYLSALDEITNIFFKLKDLSFINNFHCTVKKLTKMKRYEDALKEIHNENKKLILFAYAIRIFSFDESAMLKYLSTKKISMDLFAKLTAAMLLRQLKIEFAELKLIECQASVVDSFEELMSSIIMKCKS